MLIPTIPLSAQSKGVNLTPHTTAATFARSSASKLVDMQPRTSYIPIFAPALSSCTTFSPIQGGQFDTLVAHAKPLQPRRASPSRHTTLSHSAFESPSKMPRDMRVCITMATLGKHIPATTQTQSIAGHLCMQVTPHLSVICEMGIWVVAFFLLNRMR
jgi:hypothetical protein